MLPLSVIGTLAQLDTALKFGLWQRGDHLPCNGQPCVDGSEAAAQSTELLATRWRELRHRPVMALRGGADGCSATSGVCEQLEAPDLGALAAELGPEFAAALERNVADREALPSYRLCLDPCRPFNRAARRALPARMRM